MSPSGAVGRTPIYEGLLRVGASSPLASGGVHLWMRSSQMTPDGCEVRLEGEEVRKLLAEIAAENPQALHVALENRLVKMITESIIDNTPS